MSRKIFLVGLMGAGKTTVGRQLAKSMGMAFYDSDKEIVKRTGADISLIFDLEGESGFRNRERDIIDELTNKDNIVLATGGGVVMDADSRKNLGSRGMVVYLKANVDALYARTRKDKKRPLLQDGNPRLKLEELQKLREPLYMEIADLVVQTDVSSIKNIVQDIQQYFEELKA